MDRRAEAAITTTDLTKKYGTTMALDHVAIDVPTGAVYGLVGPNGAGKTTLLGLLAGLRHATLGSISIDVESIGVLPDTPRFDPWLTAREVVELARHLANPDVPEGQTDAILEQAGLAEAAHRRVRGYSRGMLQRLGLAAAVIGDPDMLLLDEPAAALDPAGRREVLDLVTQLRGRATVVFSSHILEDVQEVCDTIGILRRGELVYQGELGDLLDGNTTDRYIVRLRSGHSSIARKLRGEPWVERATEESGGAIAVEVNDTDAAEKRLIQVLAASEHPVVSVVPEATSLEQIFLEVTR